MKTIHHPPHTAVLTATLVTLSLLLGPIGVAHATAPNTNAQITSLFESSYAHEGAGRLDKALNATLKVLRLVPDHYVATYRAAWIYYSQGRFNDAVQYYQKAAVLAPNALEPRLAMMLPLMASARFDEAAAIAHAVLKTNPANYLAGSRLAYIYFSLGRFAEAEAAYTRVLALYPSDLEMMLGLAWSQTQLGKTAEARALFAYVLTLQSNNASAQAGIDALHTPRRR